MGKNLTWKTQDRLSVVVHNECAPTDLEWNIYLNHVRENVNIPNLRVLVWTDGGSPDGRQRKAMEVVARQGYPNPPPLAVVTQSIVVRAVMKLASIFNPHIRCYSPDQISLAYMYLGLTPAERDLASQLMRELRGELRSTRIAS
ncbi:hypothetical protein [Sorangium sp. So ce381]|uniref:hypothetical protein n=1 Tax=unclassified Sorangium TaxID=2621164 RepID=UPI003F5C7655